MKNIALIEEGTFSSALKNIKGSNSHQSVLEERRTKKKTFQLQSSNPIFCPQKYHNRINLTLRTLFQQYQQYPHNQYVIRLKPQRINNTHSFDDWISDFQQQPYHSTQENIYLNGGTRNKAQGQMSSNVTRLTPIMAKKQIQTTQQTVSSQESKVRYSFEHHFTQTLNKNVYSSPKGSIAQTKFYELEVTKMAQSQKMGSQRRIFELNNGNKQNINPNSNNIQPEITGLLFSKNKRFKSTKKKRKIQS